MLKALITLFLALIVAALGNLALSHGMQEVGTLTSTSPEVLWSYFLKALFHPWVLIGILFELAYFVLWLLTLSMADLSWALPLHAVEYIIIAILASLLLGEHINIYRGVGILFITIGVVIQTMSWSVKTEEENHDKNEHPTREALLSGGG